MEGPGCRGLARFILDTDVASLSHKGRLLKDYQDFRTHHGLRILGLD
jgi:hypothetical protein